MQHLSFFIVIVIALHYILTKEKQDFLLHPSNELLFYNDVRIIAEYG